MGGIKRANDKIVGLFVANGHLAKGNVAFSFRVVHDSRWNADTEDILQKNIRMKAVSQQKRTFLLHTICGKDHFLAMAIAARMPSMALETMPPE